MIRITVDKKSFEKTGSWLNGLAEKTYLKRLDKYGQKGVEALSAATPVDTGKTASSWWYEIKETKSGYSIIWYNDNVQKHVNIALILQFGHATRNGGWVEGVDYINPALKPIFDQIVEDAWLEVTAKVK